MACSLHLRMRQIQCFWQLWSFHSSLPWILCLPESLCNASCAGTFKKHSPPCVSRLETPQNRLISTKISLSHRKLRAPNFETSPSPSPRAAENFSISNLSPASVVFFMTNLVNQESTASKSSQKVWYVDPLSDISISTFQINKNTFTAFVSKF